MLEKKEPYTIDIIGYFKKWKKDSRTKLGFNMSFNMS